MSSSLVPAPSVNVVVRPPGAVLTAASVPSGGSTTFNVNAPHGFVAGDKFLRGPLSQATYSGSATVQSVTATTIVVDAEFTFENGAVLFNLGDDGGTIAPDYDDEPFAIYSDPDYGTAISGSKVPTNSQGEYEYWYKGDGMAWELVLDSDGDPADLIKGFGAVSGRLSSVDFQDLATATVMATALGWRAYDQANDMYTGVYAQRLELTDGVVVPTTVSGKAFIYVDTADGDLKVKFGDGTVKTLATDT